MTNKQPVPFAVTMQYLSDLFKALPKATVNTIKRAIASGEEARKQEKTRRRSSFEQLENSMPMGYTLIYESKDGKMCLYRDKEGHLLAADATKFV